MLLKNGRIFEGNYYTLRPYGGKNHFTIYLMELFNLARSIGLGHFLTGKLAQVVYLISQFHFGRIRLREEWVGNGRKR